MQAHLTIWTVSGPDLLDLAQKLRAQPGIQEAVAFGTALHVSGKDSAALERAIQPFRGAPYEWQQVRSGLEDVFIHLMSESKDNFAP